MRHYLAKFHPRKNSLMGNVVETVEYGGASYAIGYLQNKYRNRAYVMGMPVDAVAGLGLKAAALAMDAFGGGTMQAASGHVNVFGNACVGAFFHTLGAGHGMASAGMSRLSLPAGMDPKKAKSMIPGSEILGAIAPAPQGDFLSSAELASMAR